MAGGDDPNLRSPVEAKIDLLLQQGTVSQGAVAAMQSDIRHLSDSLDAAKAVWNTSLADIKTALATEIADRKLAVIHEEEERKAAVIGLNSDMKTGRARMFQAMVAVATFVLTSFGSVLFYLVTK